MPCCYTQMPSQSLQCGSKCPLDRSRTDRLLHLNHRNMYRPRSWNSSAIALVNLLSFVILSGATSSRSELLSQAGGSSTVLSREKLIFVSALKLRVHSNHPLNRSPAHGAKLVVAREHDAVHLRTVITLRLIVRAFERADLP